MTPLRQLRESDIEAVLGLYRRAFSEERPIDAAEIKSRLRNPEIKSEILRVLDENGEVAGYGDVWIGETDIELEVAAPDRWGVFLEWAEETARMHAASRVRVPDYARESGLADAVAARGYRLWRSAFTMRIDFEEALPAPGALASGISLDTFRDEDAEQLRLALNKVFAPDPFFHELSPEQFREFHLSHRGFDPSLWLLARTSTEIAGFVLAFPERMGDRTLGHITSLGVRERWRRHGLGQALLRRALQSLRARGLRAATLGVDGSNESGAVRLYERAGMRIAGQIDNWALDL